MKMTSGLGVCVCVFGLGVGVVLISERQLPSLCLYHLSVFTMSPS